MQATGVRGTGLHSAEGTVRTRVSGIRNRGHVRQRLMTTNVHTIHYVRQG